MAREHKLIITSPQITTATAYAELARQRLTTAKRSDIKVIATDRTTDQLPPAQTVVVIVGEEVRWLYGDSSIRDIVEKQAAIAAQNATT